MRFVTVKEGLSHGDGPSAEEIREQLQIILSSPAFQASKRGRQFLEYVCEKSLSGEAASLKERTVAMDVFGRQPNSELGENSIVRVGAREVRKRLMQFYASSEAASSQVRIDLPPGGYVPEFRYTAALQQSTEPPVAPPVSMPPRRRYTRLLFAAAILVIVVIAFLAVRFRPAPPDILDSFWAPALDSEDSLLLGVANPLVYRPSIRALRLNEDNPPNASIPGERPLRLVPKAIDASDIIPAQNQYVTFGDMVASHQVATMLASRGKNVRLRKATSITFNDMRRAPVILVGAVTNKWTMELQSGWRYQFRYTPGSSTVLVDTFDQPKDGSAPKQWAVASSDDDSVQEDYALVCRLRNPATAGFLVVLAGAKQWGTEAAGRLVSEPAQLASLARSLPSGWEEKNLQLVMRVRVIGNAPGQPVMAAAHLW